MIPLTPSTAREPPTVQDKPGADVCTAGAKRCPVDIVAPHVVFNMSVDYTYVVTVDASVDLIGGYDPGAYGVEMGAFYLLQGAAVLRCLPGGDDPLLNVMALREHIRRAFDSKGLYNFIYGTRVPTCVVMIAVSSEQRARQLREVLVSEELQAVLWNTADEKHPFTLYVVELFVSTLKKLFTKLPF